MKSETTKAIDHMKSLVARAGSGKPVTVAELQAAKDAVQIGLLSDMGAIAERVGAKSENDKKRQKLQDAIRKVANELEFEG